jgi:hypothetical protein
VASKMTTIKKVLDSEFFRLLLTVGKFTPVLKNNKLLKSHKTVEIKVFLNFFCLLMEVSGSGAGRSKSVQVLEFLNNLWGLGTEQE